MNYINEFTKFITGQYLTKGVRITAGAILPALILYHYDLLSIGIAMPLGALMVSLTDSPGPIHHRRNGMLVSNILNFVVAIIIGFTRYYPWLLAIELTLLGFFLSFIGIYGARASSIGLIAIIVIVLNIDVHHSQDRVWQDALFMLAGGMWYMLMSLVLYSLRPYLLIQQALGECIIETAEYLQVKSKMYSFNTDPDEIYKEILPLQINIHNQQEQLRELLFKARGFTRESTTKGRILLMMFLDSVDLFEQVMTTQQNYNALRSYFKEGDILEKFRLLIVETAVELDKLGLVIQSGFPPKGNERLSELITETEDYFVAYRESHISPENLEGFISLRHVLNSIKDIAERIKRLRRYSTYSSKVSKEVKPDVVDVEKFVSTQELDPKLLKENLSLQSNIFRHSVRVSICIFAGYAISQLFPFGHSYWILLTIVTILKPAYSLSKSRNVERLLGTIVGVFIGFLILNYVTETYILFIGTIVSMIVGYSFLQIKYFISVIGITLYVLLSFHFLHPVDFRSVSTDRIIDTAIGSAISFIGAFFILPKWEREQVDEYIARLMEANTKYFTTVAKAFYANSLDINEYKITRKEAYVALANLSDAFQRLLSEPSGRNKHPELLHQLVVSNHMLTSHIASLATYAKSLALRYRSDAFKSVAQSIELQMQYALALSQHKKSDLPVLNEQGFARVRDIIQNLRNKRVEELQSGMQESDTRKQFSGFKAISDQFELIQTIISDIINVLKKLII
ncbi:FUSC family protein [Terrimonas sp.]|uniref:FUSC family membrane protein n=1 Tax=Terrimonas sp. TaxID=1914338 RepID=UPI000D507E11|nr:FUSC family membrane protein [Terrimonas sp.]PVD51454.1 FUSC family protein [Terrimonas sp.]